jgi:hypothetical protein
MRIRQQIAPGASEFDRKLQRVDAAVLSGLYVDSNPDLVHVYGPVVEPPSTRYIAGSAPKKRRFALRAPRQPERLLSPFPLQGYETVPEAVEEAYFQRASAPRAMSACKIVGYFGRPAIENLIEQTQARLARFRDDVDFHAFAATPQPEEFDACDAWIDPAIDDSDRDGLVAEALVRGLSVVAARIAINVHRTEKGRTAFLVPPRDPNELTHAILAALFKPELSDSRRAAARQTISKFRPRQRERVLAALYEKLVPRSSE